MGVETSSSPADAGTNGPEPTSGAMRAIVRDRYGETEVLRLEEVPRPLLGDHDVVVRVAAAGLDRGAWHAMTGLPYLSRLAFGVRRPKNVVLGTDVAGTVVAVGPAVTRFSVGDEVFGFGRGTFAPSTRSSPTTGSRTSHPACPSKARRPFPSPG
jgi:NADPH:quinone reductase-like Zn-dependent oxidoreductase